VIAGHRPADAVDDREGRGRLLGIVEVADRDAAAPRELADLADGGRPELVVEDDGQSPVAWSGGRLSKIIADVASQSAGQPSA